MSSMHHTSTTRPATSIPGVASLLSLCNGLAGPQNATARKFFARELTNHMYLKANSPGFSGELTEQDVTIILLRMGLMFRTIQQSELGHESYAPKENGHGGQEAVELALRSNQPPRQQE